MQKLSCSAYFFCIPAVGVQQPKSVNQLTLAGEWCPGWKQQEIMPHIRYALAHSTFYTQTCSHIHMYVSLQQALAMRQPSLVSVSGDLESVLKKICDMLLLSELVQMVENGSDYHILLQLNTEESCNWVSIIHVNAVHMHAVSMRC